MRALDATPLPQAGSKADAAATLHALRDVLQKTHAGLARRAATLARALEVRWAALHAQAQS